MRFSVQKFILLLLFISPIIGCQTDSPDDSVNVWKERIVPKSAPTDITEISKKAVSSYKLLPHENKCDEKQNNECIKGYQSFEKKRIRDTFVDFFDNISISCQQGYTKEGNCRLGYRKEINSEGDSINILSCDHYFNGKCYGQYESIWIGLGYHCVPTPEKMLIIKQSDFDGTWGYYMGEKGCGDGSYNLLCTAYDPISNVCNKGTYTEEPDLFEGEPGSFVAVDELLGVGDGEDEKNMRPETDIYSCSIENGKCTDVKLVEMSWDSYYKSQGNPSYIKQLESMAQLNVPQKALHLQVPDYVFESEPRK